ncbi:Imm49 family immunity protein [Archangium gephyra]|uniref:Imm49 family immunity protein n=1 Tax=Archangium gephyra TaxID=48 RepID=UPI003B791909
MTLASTFLPVFRKNALYENAQKIPAVRAGRASAAEVFELCRNYRVAGICSLLMSASAREFHHFLRKSASALAFCTSRGTPAFTQVRALPLLLDALCCGEVQVAEAFARKTGATWDSRSEYEEDFLYASFLCSHFLLPPDVARDAELVDRYVGLVGSGEEPRLVIVQAFLGNDGALFEQGLESLLAARAARYQRLAAREAIPRWEAATEGCVCIEGLALVALAESKGFRTRRDYLHVPSLVRLPAPPSAAPSSWEDVLA